MVSSDTNSITTDGHLVISEVECEIGGQKIDKHKAEWLQVWTELTTPASKQIGYKAMVGAVGHWGANDGLGAGTGGDGNGVHFAQVPLQFWFCRNPGLALPLIALQYHEVKLKFTWGNPSSNVDCQVWCDYIYLDTDERRRFAQVSHEYLIEQLQSQSPSGTVTSEKLNFNHPVKELIWVTSADQTYDSKTKLQLNGHDRFSEQDAEYFSLRQPYDYHTSIPHQNLPAISQSLKVSSLIESLEDSVSLEKLSKSMSAVAATAAAATLQQVIVGVTDNIIHGTLSNNDTLNKSTGAVVESNPLSAVFTMPAGGINYAELSKGDVVQILLGGTHIKAPLITTTVEDIVQGPFSSGTYLSHTNNISVRFKDAIMSITSAAASEIDTAAELVIHSIKTISLGHSNTSKMTDKINVYSFALKPEEHQPSGTCNFSRIDNAKLLFNGGTGPTITNIYAVNYNVLRIMSGMGGLAYSN
jgi:hypothetical protein